jgi:hypothetical protein
MANSLATKIMAPIMAGLLAVTGIGGCSSKEKIDQVSTAAEQGQSEYIPQNGALFSQDILDRFSRRNVPLDTAVAYNPRFTGYNKVINSTGSEDSTQITSIVDFWERGINPGVANAYNERFSDDDISYLFRRGVLPEEANKYSSIFEVWEIETMHNLRIDEKTFMAYDARLREGMYRFEELVKSGVAPKIANAYSQRFETDDIIDLHNAHVPSNTANRYWGFNGREVIQLKHANIQPEVANRFAGLNQVFGASIDVEDIMFYIANNISFEDVERSAREAAIDRSVREWGH